MRKDNSELNDSLRRSYKRSDFKESNTSAIGAILINARP